MRKGALALLLLAAIVLQLHFAGQAAAQRVLRETDGSPVITPTLERVREKIKEIEATTDLDNATRGRLLGLYRDARDSLETANAYEALGNAFAESLKTAPAEEERINRALREGEKRKSRQVPADLSGLSKGDLEKRNSIVQADLTSLKEELAALDDLIQEQRGRPAAVRDDLGAARKSLQDTESSIKAARLSRDNPLIVEARQVSLQAARWARLKEIAMLKRELASYGVRVQLLSAQRELLSQNLVHAQTRAKPVEDALQAKIREEAERPGATHGPTGASPAALSAPVRQAVEENARLAKEIADVAEATRQTTAVREGLQGQLKEMEQEFGDARQRVHVAGFSKSLGHILLERLRKLADWRRFDRENKRLARRTGDVWLEHINVEEALRPLSNIDGEVQRLTADGKHGKASQAEKAEAEGELRALLRDQKSLLSRLSDAYVNYIAALGDLEITQQQMANTAREYRKFLESRVLWIPNAQPLGKGEPREILSVARELTAPSRLMEVPKAFVADMRANVWLFVLFLVALSFLLRYKGRLRSYIEGTADVVHNADEDSLWLTLNAFVATALLALPVPLCLAFFSWRLQDSPGAGEFTRSIGKALGTVALPYYFLRTLRLLCMNRGVAQAHFQWDRGVLDLLRRELRWFIPVFLPAAFVVSVTWFGTGIERARGGRLFFIGAMVAMSVIVARVLQPKRGVPARHVEQYPHGWISRLRFLWYWGLTAIPLLLAALSIAGYVYTAIRLASDVFHSLWFIIGALVAHDLVLRTLTVTGRAGATTDDTGADLTAQARQTRKLLHTFIGIALILGLLALWAEVFPALSALDQISLWQRTITIGGKEIHQPITLSSLAVVLVLGVLTIVLARNLPGALEVLLFKRLPITQGSRYAMSQLLRYGIIFAGIVTIFHAFGGSWSQIQWLVAALGVGLGFGLQEIFGNLISGVILLFERPIRVGDTVTIGNVTGTVSQIRMRATTITDWDNKELVIPNKSFITGQLVNWTLTSPITRISFQVGVAYGSDAALAHGIILGAVRSNPMVLKTPEPSVYFTGFGDSSMNFTVYAYAKELADRLSIIHELHLSIESALRGQGITIPFPQHDVHITGTVIAQVRSEPAGDPGR